MSARPPQVLLLRAIGLGDFLAAVPAYRAVRRAFPDAGVTLAAPAALGPLVPLVGALDRHLPVGELAPVPWEGDPPDVAVDLHGNGPASRRLLADLRPRRLVGFAYPDGRAAPGESVPWRADEHERARWLRLVLATLGGRGDPDDVLLAPPPRAQAPAGGYAVVHPGAAAPSRRWPVDRFAAVARALAARRDVVVTGSAAERDLAETVATGAGLPADRVLAGRTDLAGLASLVAGADLVVSGDTGVAHLASAWSRPSVVLFGPTPPTAWGPPARPWHVVLWHPGEGGPWQRGDPHGRVVDPRLLAVGVPEVLQACDRALRSAGDHRAGQAADQERPGATGPAGGGPRDGAVHSG